MLRTVFCLNMLCVLLSQTVETKSWMVLMGNASAAAPGVGEGLGMFEAGGVDCLGDGDRNMGLVFCLALGDGEGLRAGDVEDRLEGDGRDGFPGDGLGNNC